jgi:predicted enzyme related to lactoylglutathione lyase
VSHIRCCLLGVLCLAPFLLCCAASSDNGGSVPNLTQHQMRLHYLEIVTPDVAATCETLAEVHGVSFGDAVAELGGARTAELAGGGRIGVRAPMHGGDGPVVRPYVLVDDIAAAVRSAEAAGAQIALPPMEIPGQGTIAIYVLGGIEHGLWQM